MESFNCPIRSSGVPTLSYACDPRVLSVLMKLAMAVTGSHIANQRHGISPAAAAEIMRAQNKNTYALCDATMRITFWSVGRRYLAFIASDEACVTIQRVNLRFRNAMGVRIKKRTIKMIGKRNACKAK